MTTLPSVKTQQNMCKRDNISAAHGLNPSRRDECIRLVSYQDTSEEIKLKLSQFIDEFKLRYSGQKPEFIISIPGRVNLIGDHIDYHGFSVLPMAIERRILLGFATNKPNSNSDSDSNSDTDTDAPDIELRNSQSDIHPDWQGEHSFSDAPELSKSCQWHHYFLCGYHGVLANELLGVQADELLDYAQQLISCTSSTSSNNNNDNDAPESKLDQANGKLRQSQLDKLKLLVYSDLPQASGLSSSSALVCGSAVATKLLLHKRRLLVSPPTSSGQQIMQPSIGSREIAEKCSKFEHLIGTHGGGMDQAVVMTANEGFAKYVEFVPRLRCEDVKLPNDIVWLVSHCGVTYPKAATTDFNARVLETKLAAALIAQYHNNTNRTLTKAANVQSVCSNDTNNILEISSSITLGHIKSKLFNDWPASDIVEHLREDIFQHTNEFSVDELCKRLQMSRDKLTRTFQVSDRYLTEVMNDKLQLLNRCEHVFEEAERVEMFKSICDTTTEIQLLGQLMSQSHCSLRDKFQCSHPALDRLVSVALEAGALGSRLTGAGWGGCIITLVEASRCRTVFERLEESSKFTFITTPQSGCQIFLTT